MSEDVMIDAVGSFHAKVYDRTMDWVERVNDKLPAAIEGDEAKLDFARIVAHFTLCMVADELKNNEEFDVSPSVRSYVYNDGEDLKEVHDQISPVMGWLSDVAPGTGLLGLFAEGALPSTSLFEIFNPTHDRR